MPPRSLLSILELLKGHLFSPAHGHEGVVLLAPGHLIEGSGLNLMVLGDTKCAARAQLEETMRLLTK